MKNPRYLKGERAKIPGSFPNVWLMQRENQGYFIECTYETNNLALNQQAPNDNLGPLLTIILMSKKTSVKKQLNPAPPDTKKKNAKWTPEDPEDDELLLKELQAVWLRMDSRRRPTLKLPRQLRKLVPLECQRLHQHAQPT